MARKLILYILSALKTLYFNFKVLPFIEAIRLPFLVAYNLKLKGISKETIAIKGKISPFMIRLNFDAGSEGINVGHSSRGYLYISPEAQMVFKGKCSLAQGLSVRIDSGLLTIGDNVYVNKGATISCSKEITIGNDVLIGWNFVTRDSDGHYITEMNSNLILNQSKSIFIDDSTWIAANVTLLKGSKVSKQSVVGYGSCLTKQFIEENVIIAGYPAKILKRNITWTR